MLLHLIKTLLKWSLSLGLLGGLASGLFLLHTARRSERESEKGKNTTETSSQGKQDFVKLEEDEAERYGVETETAQSVRAGIRVCLSTVESFPTPRPRLRFALPSPERCGQFPKLLA